MRELNIYLRFAGKIARLQGAYWGWKHARAGGTGNRREDRSKAFTSQIRSGRCSSVAHALVRAVFALMRTRFCSALEWRSHECERGTHESACATRRPLGDRQIVKQRGGGLVGLGGHGGVQGRVGLRH